MADNSAQPNQPDRTVFYKENPLDQFDSASYNLRFFMAEDEAFSSGALDGSRQYNIAQTGVNATVTIDSLEIQTIQGFNSIVRGGTSVSFTMNVRQQYSADLMDRIYYYSNELNIENYMKAPYFLELKFKGRNALDSMANEDLLSKSWLWTLIITKVDISVDQSGSLYTFSGVALDDLGYSNETDLSGATCANGSTLEEYFDNLTTILSNREKTETEMSYQTIPDIYEFKIDPLIADFSPGSGNASALDGSNGITEEDKNNKVQQYSDGTSLVDLITSVVGTSPGVQKLIKNTETAEETNVKKANSQQDAFKRLIKVHTSVSLLKYDQGRNEYAKKFTYIIKLYDIARLILQQGETIQTPSSMQGLADAIKGSGRIEKQYDYIFTGMNDQVLNADIDFNMAWYAPLPPQAGLTNMASNDGSVKFAPIPQQYKDRLSEDARAKANEGDTNETTSQSPVIVTMKTNTIEGDPTIGSPTNEFGNGEHSYSILFAQASMADMINLSLDIKGDPDWLPTENFGSMRKKDFDNLEMSETGEAYIVFRFKNPQETDSETGYANIGGVSPTFSGIFGVQTVTHKFENGKFTQVLQCIRHKLIQLDKVNI